MRREITNLRNKISSVETRLHSRTIDTIGSFPITTANCQQNTLVVVDHYVKAEQEIDKCRHLEDFHVTEIRSERKSKCKRYAS